MIFEQSDSHGYGRALLVALLMAVSASTTGCNAHTDRQPVAVEVSVVAPDAIRLPSARAVMKLPVTVRLSNHDAHKIDLSASTPCAVFRWVVMTAKREVVQSKPNRLCIQVVATDTLWPARPLEQFYEITLDADRYTAGNRYHLEYQFWNYAGHHDFTVKAAAGS